MQVARVPTSSALTIDIHPGSYPNSINRSTTGVVPVAILTTPQYDAAEVDPKTVAFEGVPAVTKGRVARSVRCRMSTSTVTWT